MRLPNLLLLGAALALPLAAGCAHQVQVPQRAAVAVSGQCWDDADRPAKPIDAMRPEEEIKALDDYKVIPRLRADRLALIQHVDRLEAILDGCARLAR